MRGSVLRQRVSAWIATLAILLAALAPTISQAAYHVSGDASWLEVCTAYGMQRVAVGEDPPSPDDAAGLLAEHCSYCSFHSGCAALTSRAVARAVSPDARAAVTARSVHIPRPLLAWAASRPRAPPANR
jgi:hypothetical protein